MASVTGMLADDGNKSITDQSSVHGHLINALRPCDEATMLPGAARAEGSAWFENVVVTLDGDEPAVPQVFKNDWGAGVSVVRVSSELVEPILNNAKNRQENLRALAQAIHNELVDEEDVGPMLGRSETGNGVDEPGDNWVAGFDSTSCCCGIYSATEQKPNVDGNAGMTRAFRSYFLVAKAGSGKAGQEFHQKLMGAISSGSSLDGILLGGFKGHDGSNLSEAMLQRVNAAGRRNRARLILKAARSLGLLPDIDSVPDHACGSNEAHPVAILMTDSVSNTLVRRSLASTDGSEASRWWYYAGAIAPTPTSQGAVMCSNVSEGMLLVLSERDEDSVNIRNDAHGALPLGSARMRNTMEAVMEAAESHARANEGREMDGASQAAAAHPDSSWISQHFDWKRPSPSAKAAPTAKVDLEPPQLWGTHYPLHHERWARSLGLSNFRRIALEPELVVLAGAEAPIIRAAQAKASARYPRKIS